MPSRAAGHRRRSILTAAIAGAAIALVVALAVILADDGNEPFAAATTSGPRGFQEVVKEALPSVVQIESSKGLGSGIVFDSSGHVVTNAHVVAGSTSFQVTLADGSRTTATLRGTFPQGDLAVVALKGATPQPARFADSSKVQVGEYALAIGNPLALRSSVTEGIISSTSRTVAEGNGVALPSVIQTSAAINPGNSGGALVDESGAVIGVPTLAALDPAEQGGGAAPGIGFAISSNTVKSIAQQLVDHGKVVSSGRAWLGAELRSISGGGVLVAGVVSGGPSAKAGIKPGDAITELAGQPTPTVDDLSVALAEERPGARVSLKLVDGAGSRTVEVTLGQTP